MQILNIKTLQLLQNTARRRKFEEENCIMATRFICGTTEDNRNYLMPYRTNKTKQRVLKNPVPYFINFTI